MLVKSTVKYIQSLGQKKFRDAEGVFVAEGPKIINELLGEKNVLLVDLFALKEWAHENEKQVHQIGKDRLVELTPSELERISFLTTPNQVVGLFKKPVFDGQLPGGITLLLDSIQDPGNMGTIIRAADWFGVRQVICSSQCADAFHPKVIQSTMGSIARVSIAYEDLETVIANNPQQPVYGAFLEGSRPPTINPADPAFLLIGNESRGISEELVSLVTHKITISKRGKAESLNAAMATGIILSQMLT